MEDFVQHLTFEYFESLNTPLHKEHNSLFNNLIPDGFIINNEQKYVIIVECKRTIKQKDEARKQLFLYYKQAKLKLPDYKYYLCFACGITKDEFILNPYEVNGNKLIKTNLDFLKMNTSKPIQTWSLQKIHDSIVSNFKFESSTDLMHILQIILLSFADPDFIKWYSKDSKDVIDIEFKNKLIDNAKKYIEDIKNFEIYFIRIENISFDELFLTCKNIYKVHLYSPTIINEIYKQFQKYIIDETKKNSVWTPQILCNLMCNMIKPFILYKYEEVLDLLVNDKYPLNRNEESYVIDPCIGYNNLIKPLFKYSDNIIIDGYEIDKTTYRFSKIDSILMKQDINVINADFMTKRIKTIYDVALMNPPYTKKLSGYEALEFVIKAMSISKVGCFIFPKSQFVIDKNSRLVKEFDENNIIVKLINLGNKVFEAGTGDIIIILCLNRKFIPDEFKDKFNEFNEYDLTDFSDRKVHRKKIPHTYEFKYSDSLLHKLENYENNISRKSTFEELTKIEDNNTNFKLKQKLHEKKNEFQRIKDQYERLLYLDELQLNGCESNEVLLKELAIHLHRSTCSIEDIDKYENIDVERIKMVRLSDYFKEIRCSPIQINKQKNGQYPLISATSKNNGIVSYIDTFSIDEDDEFLSVAIDGSIGSCFIQRGKVSKTNHIVFLKPLKEMDLKFNAYLIGLQLQDNFNFNKRLNVKILMNLELYLYE